MLCHFRATNKHESVSSHVRITVEEGEIPKQCVDKPMFARCDLIVRGKFCSKNRFYAEICCHSCNMAGQIGASVAGEDDEKVVR